MSSIAKCVLTSTLLNKTIFPKENATKCYRDLYFILSTEKGYEFGAVQVVIFFQREVKR